MPLGSSQAYTHIYIYIYIYLKWKGRVCEVLAILKGDTDANKMPMGDAKLRNVK